ncbi:Na+/H+ antiporter NhaC family protein [cf. Phormidesmis sp. LEGE 11477]|uniref:Na+/H+ antiporter NhaC family protein n=1 Tax=cf. Phormidesmis sp. LEGE 11477 TaxID=1828680 RepID=UPI001882E04F|nr:Na+/H+ antiporter NhaC family protein [cf. Phormidesmis sp. LEGE 11477]MBE9059414.1 Na+/H+ antiporter NhaC family protein [cf. Phormidesmis sp. LEGE 11477]
MTQPKNNLDLAVVLFISFCLLVGSAIASVFIAYALSISLFLFGVVLNRRGFAVIALLQMGMRGARQAFPVVQVLLLIGMVTAVWMAAGTVPALVYYGIKLISAQFFILWTFLLTGAVSVLIGTSFGTVGTIGIALMVIARGSDVDVNPVAGAIIAGAFVGDRCSPMSSSAYLVASVTGTDLYRNLRNMIVSGMWPLLLSLAFYTGLSLLYPVQLVEASATTALPEVFDLSAVVLSPAIAVLLLAMLRVDVKWAMAVSIGLGCAIAHAIQNYSFSALMRFLVFGYQLDQDTPLQSILLGGGLLPMAKAMLVVLLSTAFAGIFADSKVLSFLDRWLSRVRNQRQLGQATILVSVVANLFGCTQTIAILLTEQIMRPYYQQQFNGKGREQLALSLEDTAVVIAPLVPWNIAGLIPATVLAVGPGFIPYALYLFLFPMFILFRTHKARTIRPARKDLSL